MASSTGEGPQWLSMSRRAARRWRFWRSGVAEQGDGARDQAGVVVGDLGMNAVGGGKPLHSLRRGDDGYAVGHRLLYLDLHPAAHRGSIHEGARLLEIGAGLGHVLHDRDIGRAHKLGQGPSSPPSQRSGEWRRAHCA